jgi:hypothetical protein
LSGGEVPAAFRSLSSFCPSLSLHTDRLSCEQAQQPEDTNLPVADVVETTEVSARVKIVVQTITCGGGPSHESKHNDIAYYKRAMGSHRDVFPFVRLISLFSFPSRPFCIVSPAPS